MYLQYRTTVQLQLLCMCSKQIRKADHEHKKGHAPRAKGGALIHGHLKVVVVHLCDHNYSYGRIGGLRHAPP